MSTNMDLTSLMYSCCFKTKTTIGKPFFFHSRNISLRYISQERNLNIIQSMPLLPLLHRFFCYFVLESQKFATNLCESVKR